jgi:hypothetical protein
MKAYLNTTNFHRQSLWNNPSNPAIWRSYAVLKRRVLRSQVFPSVEMNPPTDEHSGGVRSHQLMQQAGLISRVRKEILRRTWEFLKN